MFLVNSIRGQQVLINDVRSLPASGGLKVAFSKFEGYSPILDGAVRASVVGSSGSEKSDKIVVEINVKASSASCNVDLPLGSRY